MSVLTFSKLDKYENMRFNCSEKVDLKSYNDLKNKYNKLVEKDLDTYLPIYNNCEFKFCTITFKKSNQKKYKLIPKAVYEVEFNLTTHQHNDKTYINANISKLKLISQPKPNVEVLLNLD
jgi:hypothetical protein